MRTRFGTAILGLLVWLALLPASAHAQSTLASATISTAGADCSTATNCADFDTSNVPAFALYLNVGTSGTFNWEASVDADSLTGGTWFAVNDNVAGTSSATADGVKYFANPGFRRFRIRASAISGAATVVAFRAVAGSGASGTVSFNGTGEVATEWVTVRITDGTAYTTLASDATHGSGVIATGPQGMLGATSTYQTAVTTGQAVRASSGLDGIQIIRPHAHVGDFVKGLLANTDGASTAVVAAQGAGIKFCATTLLVANSSATNVTVDIRDGTAGSVIATIPAAANMGGAAITLPVPLCTSANTALAMDGSAAATTVTVTAIGYRTAQ